VVDVTVQMAAYAGFAAALNGLEAARKVLSRGDLETAPA